MTYRYSPNYDIQCTDIVYSSTTKLVKVLVCVYMNVHLKGAIKSCSKIHIKQF